MLFERFRARKERLRSLVDLNPDAVFVLTGEGRIRRINAAAGDLTGYSEHELGGRCFTDLLASDGREDALHSLRGGMWDRSAGSGVETVLVRKDGETLTVGLTFVPIRVAGRPVGGYAVLRDVTRRRKMEQALRESEKKFRLLAEHSSDIIAIVNLDGVVRYASPSHEAVLGISSEDIVGHSTFEWIHPNDAARVRREFLQMVDEKGKMECEFRYRHADGHYIVAEVRASVAFDEQEQPNAVVVVGRDISERKRSEETIRWMAYRDSLTGLSNRLMFQEVLAEEIKRASLKGRSIGVLLLDLDRFKFVNDTLGHAVGDRLLQAVSERLTASLPRSSTIARMGGDEFAVLLPKIGGAESAARMTQAVLDAFSSPVSVDGREFLVSVSVGFCVYPVDGEDPETLMRNADTAMYDAKAQGRNNVTRYRTAMNSRSAERLTLEQDLHRAVQQNEFFLHYQPRVDLRSGRPVGAEALLRWGHPRLGVVSPGDFIPIAEETGAIAAIGEWVLRAACIQARTWLDKGIGPLRVSVNLSMRQFLRQDLIGTVRRALKDSRLPPDLIELEITEGTIAQDVEGTILILNALKSMGVHISIDDFGTGYSSLGYLKRFPIDALKIDRSFVQDVVRDPEDAAIAQAVITLAHNLRMRVVAEGVETEEQRDFLERNRCDELQGYLVGRPMLPAELEDFLNLRRI